MSKQDVRKLTQSERKLVVELLIDHVVRNTRNMFDEKKKKLFKELNEEAFNAFVENKQDTLRTLEPPIVISNPTFWALAEHKSFAIWDYNRENEFWRLLITCAAYDVHHLPKYQVKDVTNIENNPQK